MNTDHCSRPTLWWTGSYTVPAHEFIRAVLLGENRYFDPGSSSFANLFDVTSNDGREHFLMPVVLSELKLRGSRRDSEGFVSIDEVYAAAQALGFLPARIHQCLDRAEEKRLLEHRRVTAVDGGERVGRAPTELRVVDRER